MRLPLVFAVLALAVLPAAAFAADDPTVTDLPEIEFNTVCSSPAGGTPLPCDGDDVAKEVGASQVEWLPNPDSAEYRFYVCPTADFDYARCTDRSGWLPADGLTRAAYSYPPGDAGQWAVAQARAFYGGQPTTPATSRGRQLSVPAVLAAGARYRLTGALKDGTVRPGMRIAVKPVDPFPSPLATGIPAPETNLVWAETVRSPADLVPGGPTAKLVPYTGTLVVPRVDALSFVLQAKNAGGVAFSTLDVPVRRAPHSVVAVVPRRTAARVGRRLSWDRPSIAAELFAGLPRPRVGYRWRRCGPRTCVDIRGATTARYTPSLRDVSRRLRLVLVAANSEGKERITLLETGVVER